MACCGHHLAPIRPAAPEVEPSGPESQLGTLPRARCFGRCHVPMPGVLRRTFHFCDQHGRYPGTHPVDRSCLVAHLHGSRSPRWRSDWFDHLLGWGDSGSVPW
ncbi:hypothetical protein G6F22_021649 [Rhizopus arrhizus]|nr:hypothetical protein G6F22_021649 [Rhizopus arrhizus]